MADKKISDFTAQTSVDDADVFELESAAGNSRKITGANMRTAMQAGLSVRGPVGWNPGVGMIREWFGEVGVNAEQRVGFSTTSIGTAGSPTTSTTNRVTRMNRTSRLSTSANAEFGWRWDSSGGAQPFERDSGLIYEGVCGWETKSTISQARMLVGLKALDNFPGASTDPSAVANFVAFGADTADANWQVMMRAAGSVAKVDTGWAKTVGELFYVRITGSSSNFKVYVEKYAAANVTMTPTATFAEATYTTDIPGGTTGLAPLIWGANGAAAENGTLSGMYMRMTSSF